MKQLFTLLTLCFISFSGTCSELYRITLLRATPGTLATLIEQTSNYKQKQQNNVSIMRHSQGDHWDLMILEPAGPNPLHSEDYSNTVDFQHTFLAKSEIKWPQLKAKTVSSNLFHIEMFHAAHGKAKELIKQREMENTYLTTTKRRANVIFETAFGSDVDSFTIGYYKNMIEFASMPNLPEQLFSKAAIDAGFKSRDDIGLYLRKLIVSHHDTLATRVD